MSTRLRKSLDRIGLALFSVYAPIVVEGAENVPASGSFILVTNHVSAFDPVVIELTCPRLLGYIAKAESLKNPLIRSLLRVYTVIPVDRSKLDLSTAKIALQFLSQGTPIMLTPEGTRSRDPVMRPFRPGFLKLAYSAHVPVVPAGISGTFHVLPKDRLLPRPGRITVRYDEPYDAFLSDPDGSRGEAAELHCEHVRRAVERLLL
jgi:1-acyl-sn-glycerol-3-phosphate acyltransferase